LRLQRLHKPAQYKQVRKTYRETESYIHLTYQERNDLATEIAQCVAGWGFARLFAECIDKVYFDPQRTGKDVDTQCFEQIVSRFEEYLCTIEKGIAGKCYGLLIHDNNETIAKKHTQLMKEFHKRGTLWTKVTHIIETPLFVNSQLTSMIQIADVCSYSLRRYLENGEEGLFNLIFQRADRKKGLVVGVRHYTKRHCQCAICVSSGKK
jgi:hypothetical protein